MGLHWRPLPGVSPGGSSVRLDRFLPDGGEGCLRRDVYDRPAVLAEGRGWVAGAGCLAHAHAALGRPLASSGHHPFDCRIMDMREPQDNRQTVTRPGKTADFHRFETRQRPAKCGDSRGPGRMPRRWTCRPVRRGRQSEGGRMGGLLRRAALLERRIARRVRSRLPVKRIIFAAVARPRVERIDDVLELACELRNGAQQDALER